MAQKLMMIAWLGAVVWPLIALAILLDARRRRSSGPGRWVTAGLLTGSAGWGLCVWAFLIEPELLVVRRVSVASDNWRGPPLRIGIISDTHAGAPHMRLGRLARIVERMNAERPDIILMLGDYAGHHAPAHARSARERAAIMESLPVLTGLKAPLGVYAVLGNHDWWYDGPAIEQAIEAEGVPVLENEILHISRPEGGFWLAGLADLESRRAAPSWREALSGHAGEEPVIAMGHWPDVFADSPDWISAVFAAHSHCGQVNLPLLGRLVHASEGSRRWPCGVYRHDRRILHVSGGVGVSILPVRFLQPPEIAVVTLRANQAGGHSAAFTGPPRLPNGLRKQGRTMAETLHFSLVSPERQIFAGDVDQVDAPGVEGEFGVLPRHAPFMTTLKPGVVRIHEGGRVTPVFVRGGFADVTSEGLTILAEEAVALADVSVASLDAEIARVRSDANDPGDEARRARAAERLSYLELMRAAL